MRDLKLSVEGKWWDSLLYKGQLHLFGTDGSLSVYAWERLVSDLAQSFGDNGVALRLAFSESNAIYRSTMDLQHVRRCFSELNRTEFEIGADTLAKYCITRNDNRFPFPHATSAFHYDRLIVASSRGVFAAHYDTDTSNRTKPVRLSPVGANQAWPALGNVAVAAGPDGLFYLDLKVNDREWPVEQDGEQLSNRACDACDWMFNNIVGTSFEEGSVLARFDRAAGTSAQETDAPQAVNGDDHEDATDVVWKAGGVDRLEDLVGNRFDKGEEKPLIWGSRDKLYKVERRHIAVYRLFSTGELKFIGKVPRPSDLNKLVSVKTALFGLVFEFDESLLVLKSNGAMQTFAEEPVNWRVFPRSRRYENHLHILKDQSLEIHSYNHDVEQNQFHKLIGTRVPRSWQE